MSDSELDVEAMLEGVMGQAQEGRGSASTEDRSPAVQEEGAAGEEGTVPPRVEEAFRRIFDRVRRALGARDEDFALGNAKLRRNEGGIQLEYHWREDREERATCSAAGKTLTVSRYEASRRTRCVLRKSIHAERDGTKISASDDRTNRQIGETDCRAALNVFEAACEAVSSEKGGSPNDEASPSDEA